MKVKNLDINILYYICDRLQKSKDDQEIAIDTIFEEFSDIPKSELNSAIRLMIDDRLIAIDKAQSRLSMTELGSKRLRSSLACRIGQFELCDCSNPSRHISGHG